MNVGLHHGAQCSVDHPMALDGSLACKSTRENADFEVTAPVSRSCVPRMTAAVVHDVELVGGECFFEPGSNQRHALRGHGATCTRAMIAYGMPLRFLVRVTVRRRARRGAL